MSTVLVTCIYNKDYIHNESIGEPMPEMRWQRFYNSLIYVARTNVPIVIYTNKENVAFLQDFCEKNLPHKNFMVVEFDITQLDIYVRAEKIKQQNLELNPLVNRYPQLVLSKFSMVNHAMVNNLFNGERYFWIDAGLSYVSLMPKRYKTGGDYDWFGYSCFSPEFIKRLESYTTEKLFAVVFNAGQGSPYLSFCGIYNPEVHHEMADWYVIGGLWGGKKEKMLQNYNTYCEYFNKVADYWETNNTASHTRLFLEEPIFSAMVCNNKQDYEVQRFDTWYTEDDWPSMPGIRTGRSFYKVITGE